MSANKSKSLLFRVKLGDGDIDISAESALEHVKRLDPNLFRLEHRWPSSSVAELWVVGKDGKEVRQGKYIFWGWVTMPEFVVKGIEERAHLAHLFVKFPKPPQTIKAFNPLW